MPKSNLASINSKQLYPWLKNKQIEIGKLISSNKLPNVLLLTGPDNTLLSYEIAKIIQNKVNIDTADINTLSDLVILGDSQEKITIDNIRELLEQAQQSAYTEAKKVFILLNIETMNNAASNCLLKILEASNSNNYFILTTNNLHKILATIVSRCFKVTIKPCQQEIIAWLGSMGANVEEQKMLLELANFSPSLALEYYSDHYISKMANAMTCINSLSAVNILSTTNRLIDLLEKSYNTNEEPGSGNNKAKKSKTLNINSFITVINYIMMKLSLTSNINYNKTLDLIKYYKQIADNNISLDITNMVYRIMYSIVNK